MKLNELRKQLQMLCLERIEARMEMLQDAIQQARSAQVDDTKSSAGDKFETTREMMSQEIDKLNQQLAECVQQKQILSSISIQNDSVIVQRGSVIMTDLGNFYLGVSMGIVNLNDQSFQTISTSSPIGVVLLGKKKGDLVQWNDRKAVKIVEIY